MCPYRLLTVGITSDFHNICIQTGLISILETKLAHSAHTAVLLAKRFTASLALDSGLVDVVAVNEEETLKNALDVARTHASKGGGIARSYYGSTKQMLYRNALEALRSPCLGVAAENAMLSAGNELNSKF